MIKLRSASTSETEAIGFRLGSALPYGKVIALFGDLGAGKTAFTRGFTLGVGIEAEVSSPTFALVNEYHGNGRTVYHFDMYRIDGWDDLYSTGYFDYLDTGASMVIEWSENIENVLPDDCVRIHILKSDDENIRYLEITGCDDEITFD